MNNLPLSDELCEKVVVGTLIKNGREWAENADLLSPDLFTDYRLQTVYRAAKAVIDQGKSPDYMAVAAELNKQKAQDISITDLLALGDFDALDAMRQQVMRLTELRQRREIWRIGQKMIQAGVDESEPIENVQASAMQELGDLFASASTDIQSISQVASSYTENIVIANREGRRLQGAPTGFAMIDQRGGLQPSDLFVIAADSSQGKSSLALNMATNVAKSGYPCAYYSLEMTAGQLFARILATETGLPSNVLNTRPLTDEQLSRYQSACANVARLPLFFDERSTSSLDAILSSIRTMVFRNHIKVAVVDYLQILNVNMKNVNKEQQMADAARRCKNLAKELNICIVLLSQLNRDRDNPQPSMARLRDSGQIAEAADVVLLIYRPEVYGSRYHYPDELSKVSTQGTAMLHICKGRNVGTFRFVVGFNASLTKFYELDTMPMVAATNDIDDNRPF
ncbi:MAG: replicative DNA helicase [Prevotella sp.]|jgi:replicative DNA helicase